MPIQAVGLPCVDAAQEVDERLAIGGVAGQRIGAAEQRAGEEEVLDADVGISTELPGEREQEIAVPRIVGPANSSSAKQAMARLGAALGTTPGSSTKPSTRPAIESARSCRRCAARRRRPAMATPVGYISGCSMAWP